MPERWRSWLGALAFVLTFAAASPAAADGIAKAARLNAEVVRLYGEGKFAEAILLAKQALSLSEKARGRNHPDVATSLNNLALLYQRQGGYAEAEQLYQRSLAIYERSLGRKHSQVGMALNNLAALYVEQGRYVDAEPLMKRGLAIWEKALGPEHADVATSLNNLAGLYRKQGRFDEAEPLYQRSLAIDERTVGPEHPKVATSLNNLALLYASQGRVAEAEPLYERSLAIKERVLGPEHPSVATSLNNLAGLYQRQGRYAEAEPLYKRDIAISERALGPDHPDVGQALNSLARLYEEQGRYAEAEPLMKRSLAIRKSALGPEHPDVAASLNSLAGLYERQGRYAEAETLMKRSIAISETALGPQHPDVATALSSLGIIYEKQGRVAEAQPLHERSLTIREMALGPEHPEVGVELNNLAIVYKNQGRYAEAESLLKRSVALLEAALGAEHPKVGIALNSMAWLALSQRDIAGAAEAWRRATAILERRAERGLGEERERSSKGEAETKSWYFAALIKSTYRLSSEAREEAARRAAAMFETAQWGAGSEAATSLAQMSARSASGVPALAALVRERQDLVAEWQDRDKRLIAARSEPPERRDAEAERALSDRLATIDARLAEIGSSLAKDFPDYAAVASPKPVAVADVRASLQDDEALVLFLDTGSNWAPNLPEETFVWVVTKTDVRWLRSPLGTASLRREVGALRCGLDASAWTDPAKWPDKTAEDRQSKQTQQARRDTCIKTTGVTVSDRELPPFDAARAHALYKSLLGEAEDLIKGKHLLIVPSGALTTLPFQVLVTEPPKSRSVAEARWLIRDHAITVLPSVSSLKSLRRDAEPSRGDRPMIGFGNPLLEGPDDRYAALARKARDTSACRPTVLERIASLVGLRRGVAPVQTRGGLADLAHIKQQTPLPETADELCAVARTLGADVREIRLGPGATEAEVKRLNATGVLSRYRILHFATHGTLAGQLSGTSEPGLILTPPTKATEEDDGYLSGSEIASLKLDADWVILSACNTAGGAGNGEAAEALSGLARVFFYAGARALLVSHWEVDSDAAVKIVTSAVGELAKDETTGRAEALRRAMLALMTDKTRPEGWTPAWHPSVWAPFVVVGEGGAAVP